jgi:ribosomal-protein-alanine N-acetyltransferase
MGDKALPDRDIRIATERLVLRPSEPGDAGRFSEIQANWNVVRTLRLPPWPPDPVAMAQWVAGHQDEWAAGTGYRFCVLRQDRIIGVCDIDEIEGGQGDLGYWFEEAAWGQGYAREAATAVVVFAFDTLGLIRLTSGNAVDNPASGAVLTRLGFRQRAEVMRFARPLGREVPYRTYELSTDAT